MARFVSVDLDSEVLMIDDGTGFVGAPMADRSATPDAIVESIDVSSGEISFNIPLYDAAFKLGGYGFTYNGNGNIYGFSGVVTQESLVVHGAPKYILSEIAVPIIEYTMESNWVTVLSGDDQIYASNQSDEIWAGTGNDLVEAGRGFDTVYGGAGNDYIQGGFNGDRLNGEEGNDDLRGGNGLDLIVGGSGNDTIRGAKGTDTLTGGEDADVFIFHTDLDGTINVDTITDFVSGVDRIELSAAIFGNAGAVGANVGLSQYITYNAETGVLSYDQDGTGAGAAKAFAILGTDSHPTSVDNIFWITA